MHDPELRKRFGSSVTVAAAARARGFEPEDFIQRFEAAIDAAAAGPEAVTGTADSPSPPPPPAPQIRVMGLVPCPVRVPMTNVLDSFAEQFSADTGVTVDYNLQAAYTGTEWMEENIPAAPSPEDVPEIFLSAGFRLFFTDPRFIALRNSDAFADLTGWDRHNRFGTANALEDPEHHFSVIGVVPAVFMVNRELLGDRPVPRSWAEILTPAYENALALPIADFDLFDALLLGVHRNFGDAGITRLARNMHQQMHPAQMVAGAQRGSGNPEAGGPVITVMPFFFTRTIPEHSPLIPVWPSDGALAAPILLISRRDRPEIIPLVREISGLAMSRVLSRLGLFPGTHPDNDDFDAEEHPLQWPGWDLLLSPELPQLLEGITAQFHRVLEEQHTVQPAAAGSTTRAPTDAPIATGAPVSSGAQA
jgi:hypothetical protein